jgi:rhodanese-related sulfurtransferase
MKTLKKNSTKRNTKIKSKQQRKLIAINAFIILVLASIIILESYYFFEMQNSHVSLQNQYSELNLSYQTLNTSYQELLNQFLGLYGNVTVEEAKLIIETKPNLIIVDVRFNDEFESGHIEGAINICVRCDPEDLEALDKNAEILVYCHSGVRSARALNILKESGHYRVYNMFGGIVAWIEAGYSIVT